MISYVLIIMNLIYRSNGFLWVRSKGLSPYLPHYAQSLFLIPQFAVSVVKF